MPVSLHPVRSHRRAAWSLAATTLQADPRPDGALIQMGLMCSESRIVKFPDAEMKKCFKQMFKTSKISDALNSFLVSKFCHEKDPVFTQRRSSLWVFLFFLTNVGTVWRIQRQFSTSSQLATKDLVRTVAAGGTGDKTMRRSDCSPPQRTEGESKTMSKTPSDHQPVPQTSEDRPSPLPNPLRSDCEQVCSESCPPRPEVVED